MSIVEKEKDEFKDEVKYSVKTSPSSDNLKVDPVNPTDWWFSVVKSGGDVKGIGITASFSGVEVGGKGELIFMTDEGKIELVGERKNVDAGKSTDLGSFTSSVEVREDFIFPIQKEDFKKICTSDNVKSKLYGKKQSVEFTFDKNELNKLKVLYHEAIDASRFSDVKEEMESGGCFWYLKIAAWIVLAIIIFSIIF